MLAQIQQSSHQVIGKNILLPLNHRSIHRMLNVLLNVLQGIIIKISGFLQLLSRGTQLTSCQSWTWHLLHQAIDAFYQIYTLVTEILMKTKHMQGYTLQDPSLYSESMEHLPFRGTRIQVSRMREGTPGYAHVLALISSVVCFSHRSYYQTVTIEQVNNDCSYYSTAFHLA